jgi:hypothetical protein
MSDLSFNEQLVELCCKLSNLTDSYDSVPGLAERELAQTVELLHLIRALLVANNIEYMTKK